MSGLFTMIKLYIELMQFLLQNIFFTKTLFFFKIFYHFLTLQAFFVGFVSFFFFFFFLLFLNSQYIRITIKDLQFFLIIVCCRFFLFLNGIFLPFLDSKLIIFIVMFRLFYLFKLFQYLMSFFLSLVFFHFLNSKGIGCEFNIFYF